MLFHFQISISNIRKRTFVILVENPNEKLLHDFATLSIMGSTLINIPSMFSKFIVFWTEDPNKWLPNLEIPNVKLTQFLICPKAKFKKTVNYVQPFDQIKRQTYKWFERIQTAWYYSREVFAIDKEWHRNKFDIMDTISENIVTSIYLWIGLASLK